MPADELRSRVAREATAPQIVRSKAHFGVSAMALNRSLHTAGRMSDWTYRRNCVRLTQMGYRSGERTGMSRERSRVFAIVFEQLRTRGITTRHVAESLGVLAEDLHDLTFGLAVASRSTHVVAELGVRPPDADHGGLRLVEGAP